MLKAQQNLVPNPSFEINDTCPITNGALFLAQPWQYVYSGINYYHECGINGFSVPVNNSGSQQARTGQAYIGYNLWVISIYESHFCGIELTTPLITGKKYHVEFYISMMDSCWYAVKNIGVYFSQSQPQSNITELLSYEPQVKYTGNDFLNDKEGWTKIEGSFYADGGEQFMTIGNFDGHNNTDAVIISGGGIPPTGAPDYWKVAAYYMDDFSVTLDTTTGIQDAPPLLSMAPKVFPNPASNQVTIQFHQPLHAAITAELTDMQGRLVTLSSLSRNGGIVEGQTSTIQLNHSPGLYLLTLKQNGQAVSRQKLIIE